MDRSRIRTPSPVSQTGACSICSFIGKQQLGMLWRHPGPPHPWGVLWHRKASRPEPLRYSSSFCPPCLPPLLPLSLRRWLLSARVSSTGLWPSLRRPPYASLSFPTLLILLARPSGPRCLPQPHLPEWWRGYWMWGPQSLSECLGSGASASTQFSWVPTGSTAPTVRWMRVLVKPVK